MAWLDAVLEGVQSILSDLGADVELPVLKSLFWLLAGIFAAYWAYRFLRWAVGAGIAVGRFAKDQVDQRFWRDPGKLRLVVGVLLFAVAYGFYGADQARPLGTALADTARGQVLAFMPLAIMTQWLLLLAFWLLLGLVMGARFGELGRPIGDIVLGMAAITGEVLCFTLALMGFAQGEPVAGLAWSLVFLAANVPLAVLGRAQARRRGEDLTGFWKSVPGLWLVYSLVLLMLCGLVAGITAGVRAGAGLGPLGTDGAVRIALIAVTVVFFANCLQFRAEYLSKVEVPESLLYFIDFSLALAAGVVAVAGVQQSPVTLGPVPAWAVAVGPPLIVAGMLFTVRLRRLRESTPRWTAVLAVAIGAAFLVLPATILISRALAPVLPQPDLPFL
ncbi:hypothetical protein AB0A73_02490 [Glycomyces sp. NPDC047369]